MKNEIHSDTASTSPHRWRHQQQQPGRVTNRQQQQSSGSGEFQPRARQAGEPSTAEKTPTSSRQL